MTTVDTDDTDDTDELRRRVAAIGWYHSIDLGNGVVTPGVSINDLLQGDELPDFTGRSVLDIGAWDGYYSFLAERSGASRVVAFDEYVWCIDIPARDRYWKECEAAGVVPDPEHDRLFFHESELPGRHGFDFAKEVLGSAVEPVVGDLMTYDLDELGAFDVVLYLGVLYHVQEPLTALRRLRQVTREVAVIETEAILVRDHEDEPLAKLWAGGELNADYGNWYSLSEAALHGMCRAAGFRRVETRRMPVQPIPPPATPRPWAGPQGRRNYENVVAARKLTEHYRIVVHAFV